MAPAPGPGGRGEARGGGGGEAAAAGGGAAAAAAAPAAPSDAARSASLRHALSGGFAGAFAKTCTAPLARLVILYQVQAFTPAASPVAPPRAAAAPLAASLPLAAAAAAVGGAAAAPPTAAAAPAAATAAAAPPGLREALARVVRSEGVASLWKGNLVTIVHRVPYSAINFYTYEAASRHLAAALPPGSDVPRRMCAGAVAGLVACTAAYPLDLVRTRLAAQTGGSYYRGIWGSLSRIAADEGLAGLYRGLGATLLQVVPSLALSFTVYETARNAAAALEAEARARSHARGGPGGGSGGSGGSSSRSSAPGQAGAGGAGGEWDLAQVLVQPPSTSTTDGGNGAGSGLSSAAGSGLSSGGNGSACPAPSAHPAPRGPGLARPPPVSAAASLAAGCLSGLVTATATFPLDVVRRRMQVEGQGRAGAGPSYASVARAIWRARGLRGFYAGLAAEYCKVVPGVALAYGTYDAMKRLTRAD